MSRPIRLLYLDDSQVDHRLMQAYLQLDGEHAYELVSCETVDEAKIALGQDQFDALVLDNRVPPHANYLQTIDVLKSAMSQCACTVVVSADTDGSEFNQDRRAGDEVVIDKANLMSVIRSGAFADAIGRSLPA